MTILFIGFGLLTLIIILIYSRLLRGIRNIINFAHVQSELPSVSVIVCLHNEENNVSELLRALKNQDYPPDKWEVILVNDRSTDNTESILRTCAEKISNTKIISIKKTDPGFAPKKYAIDTAIRQAQGSVILLTDADGRPKPRWIRSICQRYTADTGMVIGYAPYKTDGVFNRLIYKVLALEYMSHATIAAATAGIGFPITCVGTNLSYRKSVYEELGGFGQFKAYHSGDDDLFLQRVRDETEWNVVYNYADESHVANAPPQSWQQFFHQRLRYASKGLFYPVLVSLGLLIYFLFNLYLMVLPLSLLWSTQLFLVLLAGLVLKIIFEYFLLHHFATLTGHQNLLKVFPVALFLHIPYVLFFGLFGPFIRYKWAGRYK